MNAEDMLTPPDDFSWDAPADAELAFVSGAHALVAPSFDELPELFAAPELMLEDLLPPLPCEGACDDSPIPDVPLPPIVAPETSHVTETEEHERHIIFALDGTSYALPLANMLEIARPPSITPLPFAPGWLLGIANLRGDIISLVDLRAFLGMTPLIVSRQTRMIVVRSSADGMTTGLLVDGVRKIRRLDTAALVTPPADRERPAAFSRATVELEDDVVALLDINRLLSSTEMRQFDSFLLR